MAMSEFKLVNAPGEMSASIVCKVSHDFWLSTRQRQNFTASAGTNGGGLALFGAAARILKIPARLLSGAARKKSTCEPSCDSRRAKLALFNPIAPDAARTLSHGICGIGLGASGFGSAGGIRDSTVKKVFALNQP